MTIILTAKEAEDLATELGPSLGCGDHTYGAKFAEGRQDVCVVRRMAEDGYSYGYDTLYLIWKDKAGKLHYSELINSERTKNYVYADKITADGSAITVKYSASGYTAPKEGSKTVWID